MSLDKQKILPKINNFKVLISHIFNKKKDDNKLSRTDISNVAGDQKSTVHSNVSENNNISSRIMAGIFIEYNMDILFVKL